MHKTRSVLFSIYFFRNLQLLFVSFCVSQFRLFYHLADSCEIANKKSNLTNALFDVSLTMRNHTNQRFGISYMLTKTLTQFTKFCLKFYYEWYIEEIELLKVNRCRYVWYSYNSYRLDRFKFSIIWFYTISSAMP